MELEEAIAQAKSEGATSYKVTYVTVNKKDEAFSVTFFNNETRTIKGAFCHQEVGNYSVAFKKYESLIRWNSIDFTLTDDNVYNPLQGIK